MQKIKLLSFALPVLLLLMSGKMIDHKNVLNADLIIGNWQPSDGRSVVNIYKGTGKNGEKTDKYYGKIVWLLEPNDPDGKPRTDKLNPEESKRSTPLKGLVIVRDLEFTGSGNELIWEEGSIYDPKNGSDYSFEAKMTKKNTNLLDGRGYIGISLIGRTDTWRRLVKK
ncbi:MAG: DUF2147 domain-containing protein [Cytophagales bacterium]|nr:MAG: DUF2147 domain-containing protein [Cytophagales bacterium]TAF59498.1 MAG: DUF2147 domain-containing protein [Cytophagales bacterium]